MADIKKFVEEVKGLTVLELNDLVKALEEEFGVSAAAMAVAAPAAGAAAGAADAAEEKSEFNVVLKDVGANKINVIKVVREITGLGLSESKALVETPNATIKENVAKDAANEMVEKFKAAGAVAELK
ncbi:MAG: 50S ribosomal protein L7/L12 [Clostridia bacterium]|nr:50S ribosomal protein L7/L12 [Clostridia bacterium]